DHVVVGQGVRVVLLGLVSGGTAAVSGAQSEPARAFQAEALDELLVLGDGRVVVLQVQVRAGAIQVGARVLLHPQPDGVRVGVDSLAELALLSQLLRLVEAVAGRLREVGALAGGGTAGGQGEDEACREHGSAESHGSVLSSGWDAWSLHYRLFCPS